MKLQIFLLFLLVAAWALVHKHPHTDLLGNVIEVIPTCEDTRPINYSVCKARHLHYDEYGNIQYSGLANLCKYSVDLYIEAGCPKE